MKAIVAVCGLICFVFGLALHDTLDVGMGLSFYDRPGGPQGNGWVCPRCIDERSVPDGTGHSI